MKRLSLTLFCCFLAAMTAMAQFDSAPAFPGAEGYGRYTTGGRGGTVYHVTNLNDSGTGSFRAAVTGGSNRIIVFDVAGVIELQSDIKMKDNLTILGQTAPGDGITLRYYTVQPGGNNIIRFIRFRRGQERNVDDGADATWQRQKSNIILDHCSFSWSIDEVASYYDNKDFTMQWCTIGEPLKYSGHKKGPHGYGGIWGGKGASFHHNLLIHLDNRAPRLNGARFFWKGPNGTEYPNVESCIAAEKVDFRNCVIYNTGTGNGAYGGMGGNHNIVNNYYKAGPATKNTKRVFQCSVSNTSDGTGTKDVNYPGGIWGKFYISGNYVTAAGSSAANYDWTGVTIDKCKDAGVTTPTKDELKIPEVEKGSITTHAAEVAYEKVLSYAGASKSRDCIDTRYAREVRSNEPECIGSATSYEDDNGTHSLSSSDHPEGIIDVTADALRPHGGVYTLSAGTPIVDTDNDGIPDEWEEAHGLNKNSAADALTKTLDSRGFYTNLEVYANHLVQHITKAERAGATESFVEYYPLDDDEPTPALYTVTYNVNGHGTCGTSSWTQTSAGQSTTLPTVTANSGYTFLGWATSNSATTAAYTSGASYTPTANITLYAVYKQNQQGEGTIEYTLASHGSTSNSANSGISYTIPGTYIAGGGNVTHTIGTTTDNGVKMRTGNASFSGTSTSLDGTKKFEIDVNEGYAITAITFKAANNYANTSELTGIYVDGDYTNNLLTNSMTFNSGKAVAGGSFSGFTAKQKIEFAVKTTAEGSVTGTQLNFLAAITYKVATPDPTSVIVSPANKTIEVGETLQLSAQVLPAGANQSVTWSSEDASVASVNTTGKVTANATGTVKITARAENGLTDYCVLTVMAKQSGGSGNATFLPTDFSSKTGSKTKEGVTLTLNVEGNNDSSHGNTIKCKSSGNTLKFSSDADITSIVVNCNSDYSSNITKIKATSDVGSVEKNISNYTYTWTGNAKNITITFELEQGQSSDQSVYVSSIDVVTASAPTTQYITKHISSTGWASFVPEKSVVVPENVNVYYVKSNSYNSTANTVTAVKIEAGTVIKGDGTNTYGYIVNAEGNHDYQFEVSSNEAQSYDENILACGENEPIPNGSLVFACYNGNSGFYALDNYAINLPVGIVYLPASVFTGTGAPRAVTINFDEATVINNSITEHFNNSFFNINGQKVDANYRGIIIRNGRKYINK